MNEKTLLEAVVLAGELMLVSGAEIYRVEDTMNHMLKRSEYEQTETIVYGTGIFVTLSDPNKEPLTRVKMHQYQPDLPGKRCISPFL